jgi:hypothetical protein
MSATCRGAKRHEADFYATPESAFKPLLPFIGKIPQYVWEPACGDRRLITWMRAAGIESDGNDLTYGYDYLLDNVAYGCVVTNPPFSLAIEFCDHAIKRALHVFMLLRLNFLASKKRRDWWLKHRPDALFILSERPSFTDNGKTDATDYAWFYWGKTYKGFYFL